MHVNILATFLVFFFSPSYSLFLSFLRIVHTSTDQVIRIGIVALAWNMSHPAIAPMRRDCGNMIRNVRIWAKFRLCHRSRISAHLSWMDSDVGLPPLGRNGIKR